MSADTEDSTGDEDRDGVILVPRGVVSGIEDVADGDTADRCDIENVLKFH